MKKYTFCVLFAVVFVVCCCIGVLDESQPKGEALVLLLLYTSVLYFVILYLNELTQDFPEED